MANKIVLAWSVDVTNTSLGPAGAATALGAVPLYFDPHTDPVLGQFFGLTVDSDVSVSGPGPTEATRTLTLNMTTAGTLKAPPPFPCHPITSTPPVLPYPLREMVTLAGSFFVATGVLAVATTMTQLPSLVVGSIVQFLSQPGVFYTVAAPITATSFALSAAYTGPTANTGAFKEVAAPVTHAAIYSTSDLDTAPVATVPAIPAGAGAQTVTLTYKDSLGAAGSVTVSLTGRRPAAVALAGGTIDIAEITNIVIASVGGFNNSIGEITLAGLSSALPALPAGLPLGTGIGAAETTVSKVGAPVPRTFKTMTDEAQLLIDRHLAYLPPSFFALAQQGASTPQLAGDFLVTTGSTNVPTTASQAAALAATNTIEFASQPGTIYTVATATAATSGLGGLVILTTAYSGIDDDFTGAHNVNSNIETKGNLGTRVINKLTGARKITPSPAASPTNAQLSGPLGQFVDPGNAAPPPNPPLSPATMTPTPTFLSDFFTQTLQLALAGVPITPQPITFL